MRSWKCVRNTETLVTRTWKNDGQKTLKRNAVGVAHETEATGETIANEAGPEKTGIAEETVIEETEIVIDADEVVIEQSVQGVDHVIAKDRVIVAKGILARALQEHPRIKLKLSSVDF